MLRNPNTAHAARPEADGVKEEEGAEVEAGEDGDDEDEECGICREPVEDLVRAECGCGFCRYALSTSHHARPLLPRK